MIDQLSERIWSHQEFHHEAAALRTLLLKSRYGTSEGHADDQVLRRLLRSAAVLSASSLKEHRQAAYEIATAAAELDAGRYPGISFVLLLVLGRIGNFPALQFAQKRYSIAADALPTREVAEASARIQKNSVTIGETNLVLTDFQYDLWSQLNSGDSLGISAPTSAGKSFILQTYAQKLLTERSTSSIAFVVPTRALINEISEDVSDWLRASRLNVEMVTTPVPKDSDLPGRGAYVLTQERLQLIQAAHPKLSFELMLVDEAQSIADGPRGVLLSSVIEEALLRNPKMQLLFAGPNIRDPGRLAGLFGKAPRSVRTEEATVSQNIIFVDCDPEKPRSARLSLKAGAEKIALGVVECDQPLSNHKSKLVNLALRLGQGGQSLVYVMGAAECEDIAFGLADTDKVSDKPLLKELSEFVKEAVHPKYQLASDVLRGVGFHYGRLPSLVRKAVEDTFSDGDLRYLVTTSTLLHGVNLPAQNLFLHNPKKGKTSPIFRD